MSTRAHSNRLFVITGTLQVGGTERHLMRVLPELARLGWEVTLFALSGDGPLHAPLQRAGVTVRLAPFRTAPMARKPLAWRVLRLAAVSVYLTWVFLIKRPTIAHFFLPEAYLVGGTCAVLAGIRTKIMSRRSLNLYQARRPGVARLEGFLHRHMSLITGNSQAVIRELEREGVPTARLRLIYNGVDLPPPLSDDAKSRLRASLGLGSDTLVLITVANLIPYKGHRDLIDALAAIRHPLPAAWRLVCAGRDEGYGPALRQHAAAQGVGDHILWLGGRDDVAELLAAADIGILASHEEGFSNAVLEGMAAGLPMIVTDVGGNREAVLDGATGYVVPKQQPQALADTIRRLAGNAGLRHDLGAAGRARVATQFTLAACVRSYMAMYERFGAGVAADTSTEIQETTVVEPLEAADVRDHRCH